MLSRINVYTAKTLLRYFLLLTLLVLTFIFLVECLELQRRGVSSDLTDILILAALKTPTSLQSLFPLLVFISVAITLARLSWTNEVLALNVAGLSSFRIMSPALVTSLLLGLANLFLLHPLSVTCMRHYCASQRVQKGASASESMSLFKEGLWAQKKEGASRVLIHVRETPQGLTHAWKNVGLYVFSEDGSLIQSWRAKKAWLMQEKLLFQDAWSFEPHTGPRHHHKVVAPHTFNFKTLALQSFKPDLLYFWSLTSVTRFLTKLGLVARAHNLLWHKLLASVFECVALAMLAGVIGLQCHKRYVLVNVLGGGVVTGFLFYAASHFLKTFGRAGKIPIVPATWLTALVVAVLSLILLLRLEEWRKSY